MTAYSTFPSRSRWCPGLFSLVLALQACQGFSADGGAGAGGQTDGSTARRAQGGSMASAGAIGSSAGDSAAGAPQGGSAGSVASAGASGSPDMAGGPGAAGSGSSDCPCAAPTPTCLAGKCVVRGPTMVRITSFYIDSTEVTAGQYALFLADKSVDPKAQVAECAWNKTFEPLFVQGFPAPRPKQPVTYVDYCDAAAFCNWADKRVCGRISGGGLGLKDLADPNESQWFAACGGPNGQRYSYGQDYIISTCNDKNGKGALTDVGALEKCQGYYPGLFDMLGNAQEWTDTCDAQKGAEDGCERIGGSYTDTQQCSTSGLAKRNLQAAELGFRCCSK